MFAFDWSRMRRLLRSSVGISGIEKPKPEDLGSKI